MRRNNGQRRRRSLSPKKALAEAIRQLAPNATHDDLVRFTKERFGQDLNVVLIIPRNETRIAVSRGSTRPGQARRKAG